MRFRPRTPLFAVAVIGCVACYPPKSSRQPPLRSAEPSDGRFILVTKSGDTTYVSVDDTRPPRNPACVSYCRRVAACWYAMPTSVQGMSDAEIHDACLSDQDDCRVGTADTFCCAATTDCQEFVRCQARTRNVPSDCGGFQPAR